MNEERCDLLCVDAPRAEAIRGTLLDGVLAREAAERARALSDPTRLVLAASLREGGELCVCDLAWISGRAHNCCTAPVVGTGHCDDGCCDTELPGR